MPKTVVLVETSILVAADALFWFTADFGAFAPSTGGSFAERLYFTTMVALGPLGAGAPFGLFAPLTLFLAAASALLAFKFPKSLLAQLPLVFAILVWFGLGFLGASLRIT